MDKRKHFISGVTILYDYSFFETGKSVGFHTQRDVVDLYGQVIKQYLDESTARLSFINTRLKEDRSFEEFLSMAPDNNLIIVPSCGWEDERKRSKYNTSEIEFSGKSLTNIATRIASSVFDWGKCYSFNHKSLCSEINGYREFVRIRPFALNGLDAGEYLKGLDKLGADIGRVIYEYLRETKQGLIR